MALHRHPDIETFVIPDERAAAFFALGLAQQSEHPVIICCTSGSAALNYAPALAEAYYQRVALIAVTADRPAQWVDQGDGQTIRQENVYANYIRHSENLIQDAFSPSDREQNRARIICALHAATYPVNGPVHLNFPLSEPLYQSRSYGKDELPEWTPQPHRPSKELPLEKMKQDWQNARKVLIICGMLEPDSGVSAPLEQLAAMPQVVVMTETTSNLRSKSFFPCIDRLIFSFGDQDLSRFQPDLLITIGHQIISKRIKAILRERKPSAHWHIDQDVVHPNTFQALTLSLHDHPENVLKTLVQAVGPQESEYSNWLKNIDRKTDRAHEEFMHSCPHSDHKSVEALLNVIPEDTHFHIGNSASVRYIQLFKQGRTAQCHSNRGTSGIDGCTSTAMGAAKASGHPTVLLTGDMAFLYDSNAFWHKHVPENLKIVVLHNGGGGIFRIIDGAKDPKELETYFEAHHQVTAEDLARMFRLQYECARDHNQLEERLRKFIAEKSGPAIFEIFTPREENDKVLKRYFAHLKEAVNAQNTVSHE
jgi:2-succinyl-5-enolpyruvyl-6-hydroxy-3-cyclohexene-1-carboxylate synthase